MWQGGMHIDIEAHYIRIYPSSSKDAYAYLWRESADARKWCYANDQMMPF